MIDINVNDLQNLQEVPLEINPNYSFEVFIGEYDFSITIRTFVDDQTTITITKDDVILCDNAPVTLYSKNLIFFSGVTEYVFFFLRNDTKKDEPNFLNFSDNDLRLFYATI